MFLTTLWPSVYKTKAVLNDSGMDKKNSFIDFSIVIFSFHSFSLLKFNIFYLSLCVIFIHVLFKSWYLLILYKFSPCLNAARMSMCHTRTYILMIVCICLLTTTYKHCRILRIHMKPFTYDLQCFFENLTFIIHPTLLIV